MKYSLVHEKEKGMIIIKDHQGYVNFRKNEWSNINDIEMKLIAFSHIIAYMKDKFCSLVYSNQIEMFYLCFNSVHHECVVLVEHHVPWLSHDLRE
jgi:hypothetical protein